MNENEERPNSTISVEEVTESDTPMIVTNSLCFPFTQSKEMESSMEKSPEADTRTLQQNVTLKEVSMSLPMSC